MTKLSKNQAVLLFLFIVALVIGYLAFRYFYGISFDYPFSQELILVFLGAIATVLITAILLNQQTELELRKEGQVLLLDQKSKIYLALIDKIGEIVEHKRLDEDALADMRTLNHKLAMIGSADVITRFNAVLNDLSEAARDGGIETREGNTIMQGVATLTFYMRNDLLGQIEGDNQNRVLQAIRANNAGLES